MDFFLEKLFLLEAHETVLEISEWKIVESENRQRVTIKELSPERRIPRKFLEIGGKLL